MSGFLLLPYKGTVPRTQGFGPTSYEEEPSYAGYAHFHTGIDYGVPLNTPIYASSGGKVSEAGWDTTGYGNKISIDIAQNATTLYGHLNSILVKVGQIIQPGQLIGYSGSTGHSSGPHLHFGLKVNGTWVDPTDFFTNQSSNGGSFFGGVGDFFGGVGNTITGIPGKIGDIAGGAADIPGKLAGIPGDIAQGVSAGITEAIKGLFRGVGNSVGFIWEHIRKYVLIVGLFVIAVIVIAALVKGE